MQPAAVEQNSSHSIDPLFEDALYLFQLGNHSVFNRLLSQVPEKDRLETIHALSRYIHEHYGTLHGNAMLRRLVQHENFRMYCQEFPHIWEQGIFFTNFSDLRTRVAVSLFEHPEFPSREVDYTCLVHDPNGNVVYRREDTLIAGATHSFDIKTLVSHMQAPMGLFCLRTSERHLHSLRIYAYWSNENSMTTTHEKGALANLNNLIIYPTIVANDREDTYIALSNCDNEKPIEIESQLYNCKGETFPQSLQIKLAPRSSVFFSLSQQLKDLRGFLHDRAGVLYLTNDHNRGIYYYFIHNKVHNSWQIQHM